MSETIVQTLIFWFFPALLVYAAINDLVSRRIPNWVSLALIAGFVVLAFVTRMTWVDLGWSVGVAFLAFAIGFVLFALGQMGGGDVKLIAATLLWFGATQAAVDYVVAFSLWGAGLTLLMLARRIGAVQLLLASNRWSARFAGRVKGGRETPYGVAIAIGALTTLPFMAALHAG